MALRLFAPRASPMLREMQDMENFGNALFNPNNWGRDITSRETATMMHPVTQGEDGKWKMEVYVDMHKFKPSDVKIITKDGRVTVEAEEERKNEDGSFFSYHHHKRTVPIPQGVDGKAIEAKFTEEGGVLLEAPAQAPKAKETHRLKGATPLPITHQ